jgi:DNA polymerase
MSKNSRSELEELKRQMSEDGSLPLRKGATNLVFGEGSPEAEVMFIGEGPGYWEDQKARPFVGNAGAFLNQLLHLIKLPREQVFITNVVHYRPPGNRDPLPAEIFAFGVYLNKMIDIIRPKMIVTLGRFSMAKFIPNVMISRVHGRPHRVDWKGKEIVVIPMYHPAAGLRNGEVKRKTIDDFRKIPKVLEGIGERKKEEKQKAEQMKLI